MKRYNPKKIKPYASPYPVRRATTKTTVNRIDTIDMPWDEVLEKLGLSVYKKCAGSCSSGYVHKGVTFRFTVPINRDKNGGFAKLD